MIVEIGDLIVHSYLIQTDNLLDPELLMILLLILIKLAD